MWFDRTEPLGWPVVVAAGAVFGVLTLVGAPVCSFIWDWFGLGGWLLLGSAMTIVLAEAVVKR